MKKLLTLMLVTVTTLTALGVGYALWSETLTIAGTVSTGTVDINFSGGNTAYDDESLESGGVDSLVENGGDPDTTVEDKDVGTCTESGGVGSQSYSITVGIAYPSYDCFFHFDINYQGTIPAHVQVTQILPTGGNGAFPLQLLHLNCTFDDAQGGVPSRMLAPSPSFLTSSMKALCSTATGASTSQTRKRWRTTSARARHTPSAGPLRPNSTTSGQ